MCYVGSKLWLRILVCRSYFLDLVLLSGQLGERTAHLAVLGASGTFENHALGTYLGSCSGCLFIRRSLIVCRSWDSSRPIASVPLQAWWAACAMRLRACIDDLELVELLLAQHAGQMSALSTQDGRWLHLWLQGSVCLTCVHDFLKHLGVYAN